MCLGLCCPAVGHGHSVSLIKQVLCQDCKYLKIQDRYWEFVFWCKENRQEYLIVNLDLGSLLADKINDYSMLKVQKWLPVFYTNLSKKLTVLGLFY